MMIPMHTSKSANTPWIPKELPSLKISVDKITPNTGLKNPKIVTFDTGLYFNKMLHMV